MKMKETARFKQEFVEKLKSKIPSKILELGLEFPKEQGGIIRLEYNVRGDFKISAVYLEPLGKKKNIILKFQYRDFHHIKPSFVFTHVYIRKGNEENRYDSKMNLESKYSGFLEAKSNGEEVRNAVYKIESKGKKVNIPYHMFINLKPPLPNNFSHHVIEKITKGYDAREEGIWMCKGDVKDNIIYLGLK